MKLRIEIDEAMHAKIKSITVAYRHEAEGVRAILRAGLVAMGCRIPVAASEGDTTGTSRAISDVCEMLPTDQRNAHKRRIAETPQRQHLPSPQEIVEAMSDRGGWTRSTLASWGVSWPPPKGWRVRLEHEYEKQQQEKNS